jgi:outer membrane lipopolysaccharide assembly protein LptE/RlpB
MSEQKTTVLVNMQKSVFIAIALMATVLLSACGKSIEGTYKSPNKMYGMLDMKFKSDGTVQQMGQEIKYEIDGDEIKLISPKGTSIMKIIDENTIKDPMFGKLVKVEE